MHPRLAEISDYLDESREVLLAAVANVPESRRDERSRDGSWTVGEVLDHLALVEGSVVRLLERRAERARAEGLGPDRETTSILGCLDDYRVDSRERLLEAPEMVRPGPEASAAAALAALGESRRALRAAMERADGLDLTAVGARHPILGELHLYRWLVMVGKHERRHALQIEALRGGLATR
jgi:hypothetical protein